MPLRARLVIAAYAGLYLLISAVVLGISIVSLPSPWLTFTVFALVATAILLWLTAWRLKRPER